MPPTQLRGTQIADGGVQRQDLDVSTPGSAVIRKVLAGTRVSLSSTGPDAGTGDVTVSVQEGPGSGLNADLLDGEQGKNVFAGLRANANLHGGGTITTTNNAVKWSNRFIFIGDAAGTEAPSGSASYLQIVMPNAALTVPVLNGSPVTITADGIPLTAWQALYYDLSNGHSVATSTSGFTIISYTLAGNFCPPPDWVLIAANNGDQALFHFGRGLSMKANQSWDTTIGLVGQFNAKLAASHAGTGGAAHANATTAAAGFMSAADKLKLNSVFDDFTAAVVWNFDSTVEGWTSPGATLANTTPGSLTITSTGTDPRLERTGLSINGALNRIVRLKIKRIAGSGWDQRIFYSTSGHSYTSGFTRSFNATNPAIGETILVEMDMASLSAGGTDWIDSTITGLQFDIGNTSSDVFEIDWIAVGRYGPPDVATLTRRTATEGITGLWTFGPASGTFVGEARTDIGLIFGENAALYTMASGYIRNLIKRRSDTNDIEVGHSGTSFVRHINLVPGNSGEAQVAGSKIWHAGNDGAGSGLDADLLDGLDSAAFQLVSQKGAAGGYAGLDGSVKVPIAQIPTIGRSQLNVSTAGEAVTRKILAGAGVALSSTGADMGTGDVTISAVSNASLYAMNLGMNAGYVAASVASNALTIAIKHMSGNDPSATEQVLFNMRDPSAGSGILNALQVSTAFNLVVPAGATLGVPNNEPFRIWLVVLNDGGTLRLGVINCRRTAGVFPMNSDMLVSAVSIDTGADLSAEFYANASTISTPMLILAYLEWEGGLVTAGNWASAPTKIQLFGSGIPMPGAVVQEYMVNHAGSSYSTSPNTFVDAGGEISITPRSGMNLIAVDASWNARAGNVAGANAAGYGRVYRSSGGVDLSGSLTIQSMSGAGGVGHWGGLSWFGIDNQPKPYFGAPLTYKLQHAFSNTGGNIASTSICYRVREIMA